MKPGAKLTATYLFKTYYKDGQPVRDGNGRGFMEPLRNTVLVLYYEDAAKNRYEQAVATDATGKIVSPSNKILSSTVVKTGSRPVNPTGNTYQAILPPFELVNLLAFEEENWQAALLQAIKEQKIMPQSVPQRPVTQDDLLPPRAFPQTALEKEYKDWYGSLAGKTLDGLILAKKRALFCSFSSDIFRDASVRIWPPGYDVLKSALKDGKGNPLLPVTKSNISPNLYLATCAGDHLSLPPGVYTIEVTIDPIKKLGTNAWNPGYLASRSFRLRAVVNFPIVTPAGEFDVVHCDPVTVEEALFSQFPQSYGHLLQAAEQHGRAPDPSGVSSAEGPAPAAAAPEGLPAGLVAVAEHVRSNKSKVSWVAGLLSGANWERAQALADALYDSLKTANPDDPALQTVNLVFSIKDLGLAWKNAYDKAAKDLAGKIFTMEKQGRIVKAVTKLERGVWAFTHPKLSRAPGGLQQWAENAFVKDFGETIQNAQWEKTHAFRAEVAKGVEHIDKIAGYVSVGLDVFHAIEAGTTLYYSKERIKDNIKKLDEQFGILDQYYTTPDGQGGKLYYTCRREMQNLESLRALTINNVMQVEEDIAKLQDQLGKIALGIVCLYPPAAVIVGLWVAVKSAVDATVSTVKSGWDAVDQYMWDRYWGEMGRISAAINSVTDSNFANQELLRHAAARHEHKNGYNMEVQYRIRAHVLDGLHGLLTRAAASTHTECARDGLTKPQDRMNRYLEKINEYKVDKYIQNFILDDQWVYSYDTYFPINMDTWWMYSTFKGSKSARGKEVSVHNEYFGTDRENVLVTKEAWRKFKKKSLSHTAIAGFSDIFKRDEPAAKNVLVDFQKAFPIHCMASLDGSTFAEQLRPVTVELGKDCIAYSAIYFGERSPPQGQDAWTPITKLFHEHVVQSRGGTSKFAVIESLSPLHRIKIVVVLKDDLPVYPYPIRLQLVRRDYFDSDDGPVYKGIVRKLNADELDPAEAQYAGRMGAVFYPFFQYECVTLPGTKPMANTLLWPDLAPGWRDMSTDIYYYLGWLEDMEYGFEATVGDNQRTRQFLKLGAKTARDSYNVTVNKNRTHKIYSDNGTKSDSLGQYDEVTDEKNLINHEFLLSRSSHRTYPDLFVNPYCRVMLRFVDGDKASEFIFPHESYKDLVAQENAAVKTRRPDPAQTKHELKLIKNVPFGHALVVNDFDWATQVEFMVVVSCETLNTEKYVESFGMDWTSIPLTLQLGKNIGELFGEVKGPEYGASLKYLGQYDIDNNLLEPHTTIADELYPVIESYLLNTEAAKALIPLVTGPMTPNKKKGSRHLFAAHIVPSYESLRGKMITGIRPFGMEVSGKQVKREDKQYLKMEFLINSAGQSGIKQHKLKQYNFWFMYPKYMHLDTPWVDEPEDRIIPGVSDVSPTVEKLRAWIKDYPSVRLEPYANV